MKTYNTLQEGVYDQNIFKAFFLAGGPGSGKSYVVRKTTGGTGLKTVNSDAAFEKLA
jgi:dephospho-CoA kinase